MDPADSFLQAYHRADPGVTSRAFARGVTEIGGSSYDRLSDIALASDTDDDIVDLGCGDGYLLECMRARDVPARRLVGVDMSPDELARARARESLAGVRLLEERAQCTSLGETSAACVVSHMAFMLMRPVEAVVDEIARITRPGGVFAAVVGGGPRATQGDDAFTAFLDLFVAMLRDRDITTPRLGDRRTRTDDGLAELLDARFEKLAIEDFELRLDGPLDTVWDTVSTIYESFLVSADDMAALREQFSLRIEAMVRPDGTLPCAMWMRLVTCTRRPT